MDSESARKVPAKSLQKTIRNRIYAFLAMLCLILILLMICLLRGCMSREITHETKSVQDEDDSVAVAMGDTSALIPSDTTAVALPDTAFFVDTVPVAHIKKTVPPTQKRDTTLVVAAAETIDTTAADTVAATPDTIETPTDSCDDVTAELWVYPDPSGGLHQSAVTVTFVANRAASIQYRIGDSDAWHHYTGEPISIKATATLFYDAIDSCGKIMERREEYYEVSGGSNVCDPSMVAVKVGTMHFCIDKYEWPNLKGGIPQAYISYYQAQDSCFIAKKRLCTTEEWSIACSGPYSAKYPYGQLYERYGCTTHDTTVARSGINPECRSFFGAYDMSGNLAEWTSTKSVENSAFYYVTGGFWDSGPKSGCFDKRYSYYPQNQHNPVGFRCCKDIQLTSESKQDKGK